MVKDPRGTVDLQVPPGWKCDCCFLPRSKCATRWNTKWNHPPKSRILLCCLPWELWSHFITGIRQAKIKFSIHPFFLSSYFDWELEKKCKSERYLTFSSHWCDDKDLPKHKIPRWGNFQGLGERLHLSLHHYTFWRWWQDQSLSIPSQLNPVHAQGRNAAELCRDPLHVQRKTQNLLNPLNVFSCWSKNHTYLVPCGWNTRCLKQGGRTSSPFPVFFEHTLVHQHWKHYQCLLEVSNYYWTATCYSESRSAKAWWPAALPDRNKVKILLKSWRKKWASATLMHKSLSSDEW